MNLTLDLEYSEKQEQIFFNWPEKVRYKVITKGRRASLTKGGANYFIDSLCSGLSPLLWGDTINANINRYFERYFQPELKKNNIPYHWNERDKQLRINGHYCDFRSADNPENWEGFGYKIIFLNEAGIILKNSELYTKTVLPMLIDYADSKLIAGGVPKGKKLRTGQEHTFYTLFKRCESGEPSYQHINLTTYDNPWLTIEDIKALEKEIEIIGGTSFVDQEIYGRFVDKSTDNPFATQFDRNKHVRPCKLDQDKHLYISIDFNLNPFGAIAGHVWNDAQGAHCHICEEVEIKHGSLPAMIEEFRLRYGKWLHKMTITGDYSGNKKELSLSDNASHFIQLKRGLLLRDAQISTPVNPKHANSRADYNYILYHHPDFRVDDSCKSFIFDNENVEWDNIANQIVKLNRNEATQKADFLDCGRYFTNAFLFDWLTRHEKQTVKR